MAKTLLDTKDLDAVSGGIGPGGGPGLRIIAFNGGPGVSISGNNTYNNTGTSVGAGGGGGIVNVDSNNSVPADS